MKLQPLVIVAVMVTIMHSLVFPQAARAVPHDGNPKILLQVRPTTTKNLCQIAASPTAPAV